MHKVAKEAPIEGKNAGAMQLEILGTILCQQRCAHVTESLCRHDIRTVAIADTRGRIIFVI